MIQRVWNAWRETSLHQNVERSWRRVTAMLVVSMCAPVLSLADGPILAQPSAQMRREIARLLDGTLPHFQIDPQALPERFRRQAIKRIYDYTVLYRADMQVMFDRAAAFLPMIKRTFRRYELPMYFAYIPLVESRFRVDAAHPRSGAAGLWQLMPITARGYGLQVSSEVDERLDPRRATQAAARYLQWLHERFGADDPLCILAAYNYGGANLIRAMKRAQTQDIIELYTYRRLPYETRDYLIKMVALWVVTFHAAHFEFVPKPPPLPPVFTEQAPLTPVSLMTVENAEPLQRPTLMD